LRQAVESVIECHHVEVQVGLNHQSGIGRAEVRSMDQGGGLKRMCCPLAAKNTRRRRTSARHRCMA
jgi:hypothetical protein